VVGVLVHDAYPRPYERSELPTSSDLLRRTTAALVVASLVAVMLSTAPASAARADDAYHEEDHHHRQQAVRVPKGRGVDRPRLFEVRGRLSGGAERRGRRRGERRRVRFPVSGPPRPRLKGGPMDYHGRRPRGRKGSRLRALPGPNGSVASCTSEGAWWRRCRRKRWARRPMSHDDLRGQAHRAAYALAEEFVSLYEKRFPKATSISKARTRHILAYLLYPEPQCRTARG
jgi:hypothetical protein